MAPPTKSQEPRTNSFATYAVAVVLGVVILGISGYNRMRERGPVPEPHASERMQALDLCTVAIARTPGVSAPYVAPDSPDGTGGYGFVWNQGTQMMTVRDAHGRESKTTGACVVRGGKITHLSIGGREIVGP